MSECPSLSLAPKRLSSISKPDTVSVADESLQPTTVWLQIKTTSISGHINGDKEEEGHKEDNVNEVQIATNMLTRIGLFNDLINCCSNEHNKIPFPSQYSDIAMIYINFINNLNRNILQDIECGNLLPQALKLCHYLDDGVFLKFLVNYMHGNITRPSRVAVCNFIPRHTITNSWSSYNDMIATLPDNLQTEIYLLSPFIFAPAGLQNSQAFINSWIKVNVDNNNIEPQTRTKVPGKHYGNDITKVNTMKRSDNVVKTKVNTKERTVNHMIDNKYWYSTHIVFYDDEQNDVHGLTCRRSTVDNCDNWLKYGPTITWYPKGKTNGNKVKYTERTVVNDKVSCYKMWHKNGNLKRVSNYIDNEVHNNNNKCKGEPITTMYCEQIDYYDSGQIEQQHYYNNGVSVGTWQYWYESGNLQSEFNLDQHGNKHGSHKHYYDSKCDNSLKYEYHFEHGEEVGTFKAWYEPVTIDNEYTTVATDDANDVNKAVVLDCSNRYYCCNHYHQSKYEYTFIHDDINKFIYKEWNADGTIKYNFECLDDQTTIPQSLKDMSFKDCSPNIYTTEYGFYH